VGIDEDKIPISQQQINIPHMTSLSHLANQNAPEETGHRQDPLTKPSTSQTHTRAQAIRCGLSHCAQHPPTICKALEFHQIQWPNTGEYSSYDCEWRDKTIAVSSKTILHY